MVSFLLKNNPYGIITMFFITLGAWLLPVTDSPEEYSFFAITLSYYPALSIGFTINLLAASFFNQSLSKYFFVNDNATGFVFLHLLITSLASHSPDMISFSLLTLALSLFMSMVMNMKEYGNEVTNVFNSAFFLGVLSLVNIVFLPFIYLIIAGVSALRRVNTRDILIVLFGLVTPLYIVLAMSYMSENYTFFNSYLNSERISSKTSTLLLFTSIVIFGISTLGIVLFKQNRIAFGAKIIKAYNILVFLFVISIILTIAGFFTRDFSGILAWGAFANAVFISTLFLKIDFRYKDAALFIFLVSIFGVKYFL